MIVMPRRSVTRFFIPLIDVLTLLFCIFLLMPLFREDTSSGQEAPAADTPSALADENARLQRELERRRDEIKQLRVQYELQIDRDKLGAEVDRLRKEKNQALTERLFVRVLEIDARTGALSYPDPAAAGKQGFKITSAEAARDLIRRHQQQAGSRELYYVFLFPSVDSSYPTEEQFEQYRRWFADVAWGVGNSEGQR
jgi:hypothetical protein